jgi:hypothetical protein
LRAEPGDCRFSATGGVCDVCYRHEPAQPQLVDDDPLGLCELHTAHGSVCIWRARR